jgi:hypothetical protein
VLDPLIKLSLDFLMLGNKALAVAEVDHPDLEE